MFWLSFYQIGYIAKLIVFLSLYHRLFPVVLEQNLILTQGSLLIFYIPNESISELNVNRLMYFQLEVDYYSNEANRNKYKNVQLIASTKNNLKIATDCTGNCTCNDNLSDLLLGLQSTLLLGIGVV